MQILQNTIFVRFEFIIDNRIGNQCNAEADNKHSTSNWYTKQNRTNNFSF